MSRLPAELQTFLLDATSDELHESRLRLSAGVFGQMVDSLHESQMFLSIDNLLSNRLIRLLKANARHWAYFHCANPTSKAGLYEWVVRQAVKPGHVSAAKLLLHFTSNSSPAELPRGLAQAHDFGIDYLATMCRPSSPSKHELFLLKTIQVTAARLPNLSAAQVSATARMLCNYVLPNEQVNTSARASSQSLPWSSTHRQTPSKALDNETDLSSEGEHGPGASRRTLSQQCRQSAMLSLEALIVAHRKAMRPFWTHLVASDSSKTDSDLLHLATVDPAVDLRLQAYHLLAMLFKDSEFLQVSQERSEQRHRGFKALSDSMASLVRLSCIRLFRSFGSLQRGGLVPDLANAAVQSLASLVIHTTWSRMRSDLPQQTWKACCEHLDSKDPSFRDNICQILSTLLSTKKVSRESAGVTMHAVLESTSGRPASEAEWTFVGSLATFTEEAQQEHVLEEVAFRVQQMSSDCQLAIDSMLPLALKLGQPSQALNKALHLSLTDQASQALRCCAIQYIRCPQSLFHETLVRLMRLLADSSQTAKLQVIGWTSLGSLCAAQDNVLPSTTLKEVIAGFRQGFEVVTKATAVSFSWALANFWYRHGQKLEKNELADLGARTLDFIDKTRKSTPKVALNMAPAVAAMLRSQDLPESQAEKALQALAGFLSSDESPRLRAASAGVLHCVDRRWEKVPSRNREALRQGCLDILRSGPFNLVAEILKPENGLDFLVTSPEQSEVAAILRACEARIVHQQVEYPFQQAQKVPQILDRLQTLSERLE